MSKALQGLCQSRLAALPEPVVTGGEGYEGITDEAWALDVGTLQWRALPDLQTSRFAYECVSLPGGAVLCLGGVGESSVEALEPGAAEWTPRPPLPAEHMYDFGAVACEDGTVLLLGGYRSVNGNTSRSAAVEQLDPATGECTPLPPLSQPRTCPCAGLLPDGRVLLAGGVRDGEVLALAEMYDPATGVSTRLSDMTTPRCDAASCWLPDGRFAVLGGHRGVDCLTSCEAYDPATNAWETLPDLCHAWRYCAAWVVGGQVVVAGGDGGGEYLDSVEVLDEGLREWRLLPLRLPRPLHRVGHCLLPSA